MRPEKKSIIEELKKKLKESGFVFLTDYRGLTVAQVLDLRNRLKGQKSQFNVVKNSFLAFASKEEGDAGNLSGIMEGPTAIVTGNGDPSGVAKVLVSYSRENERPVIKGGVLMGRTLTAADVVEMSMIPPREVLLAKFVYVVASPLSGLAGVMRQKLSSLLYALKAVEKKKG